MTGRKNRMKAEGAEIARRTRRGLSARAARHAFASSWVPRSGAAEHLRVLRAISAPSAFNFFFADKSAQVPE